MPKVIIELCNGTIKGVYSDSPVDFDINICDFEDQQPAQYFALQHQIQHGGLRHMLQATATQDISENTVSPSLDPNAFLLIRDPNIAKTELGQQAQRLLAVFIDGYLSASAELSRFIRNLYKSKHPDAVATYHALIPLIDRQDRSYDFLCQQLNQAELFDEAVRGESVMFDNLIAQIDSIESNMVLKSDYSEELERLNALESDACAFRFYGVPTWKVQDLLKRINHVRNWIKQEAEEEAVLAGNTRAEQLEVEQLKEENAKLKCEIKNAKDCISHLCDKSDKLDDELFDCKEENAKLRKQKMGV